MQSIAAGLEVPGLLENYNQRFFFAFFFAANLLPASGVFIAATRACSGLIGRSVSFGCRAALVILPSERSRLLIPSSQHKAAGTLRAWEVFRRRLRT